MLNKLQQRKQDGFTIIEVMIVLAIAGLIMLIVFLAVPALNRSSHNTSIKNDVSGILGAAEEYSNNNNGKVPTGVDNSDITHGNVGVGVADCSTSGANCGTAKVSANTTKVALVAGVPTGDPTLGIITIATGTVCGNENKPVTDGAVARSITAYFMLEGGAIQCQQS